MINNRYKRRRTNICNTVSTHKLDVTYVLVYVIKATIARDETRDFLAVFDKLHTDTLTNGGVRLLGLKAAKKSNKNEHALVKCLLLRTARERLSCFWYRSSLHPSDKNSHFLQNNSLRHAWPSQRIRLHGGHGVWLVILLARPSLMTTMIHEFATSAETTWLTVI